MAFTTWPRNGFTPSMRSGTQEQFTKNYPAQASSNQSIGIGDAVAIVNGIIVPATAGQDPDQAGFGIVIGVYTTANRPFTHQNVKCIASGQPGRADVYYNPDAEFVVRCETSVGNSNIDKNVTLVASGANATLGRSTQSVLIPASASVNDLFRVVRIAGYNDIVGTNGFNADGGAGQPVVVRWNRHVFNPRNAGQ